MRWLKTTSQAVKEAGSQTLIDGGGRDAIYGVSTTSIAGASKSGGQTQACSPASCERTTLRRNGDGKGVRGGLVIARGHI